LIALKLHENGDFSAVILHITVNAIGPDLVRQEFFIDDLEAKVFEELRFVGQGKDLFEAEAFSFSDGVFDEFSSDAAADVVGIDGHASDFAQVAPEQCQTGAAEDFSIIIDKNAEFAETFVQIFKGPKKHTVSFGIIGNQVVDGIDILHGGGTDPALDFFVLVFHSFDFSDSRIFVRHLFFFDHADDPAVGQFGYDLFFQIGLFDR
jgi:hypothetical protein